MFCFSEITRIMKSLHFIREWKWVGGEEIVTSTKKEEDYENLCRLKTYLNQI